MKYIVNGNPVSREEFVARGAKNKRWMKDGAFVPKTYQIHDPLISEGLGVMKSQVQEAREVIRRHNIQGVSINDNGQAIITSRRGRKEYSIVRGLRDADAGYSD